MKTTINDHGCTTHPYAEPSLEVTVPVVINGTNVTEKLTQLTVANLNLNMKVEELEQALTSLQSLVKALQESQATNTSVSTTEEPVVSRSGKKTAVKSVVASTETVTTTVS